MEVQSSSGSRRSRRAYHAEAPGTTGDGPLQAQAFMVPAALADVAIVRVEIPSEQVLASGAQGTIRGADERKVSSIRIVDRDFAGDGTRAQVHPGRSPRVQHYACENRQQEAYVRYFFARRADHRECWG